MIARDLKHKFIVEYKYFIHEYNESKKRYRTHTVIEFLEGKDLKNYIDEQNKKRLAGTLNKDELILGAKKFGSQIMEALSFLYGK